MTTSNRNCSKKQGGTPLFDTRSLSKSGATALLVILSGSYTRQKDIEVVWASSRGTALFCQLSACGSEIIPSQ